MDTDRSRQRQSTGRGGEPTEEDDDDLPLESDASLLSAEDEFMSSDQEDEDDDFEEDKTLAEHRRKMKGKGRDEGHEEPSGAATKDQHEDDRPQRWKLAPVNRFASGSNGSTLSTRGSVNARSQSQPRREQSKGPPREQQQQKVVPPTKATREEAEMIRELKRQAYLGPRSNLSADIHPSRTRKQQKQQEKEEHRDTAPTAPSVSATKSGKNVNTKSVPAARPTLTGKAPARTPAFTATAGTRRDGRPNLNARMGLLLEQIQRSK